MLTNFDKHLSMKIDYALWRMETSHGTRRLFWRLILSWLERSIP